MSDNKTTPTRISVESFLSDVSADRSEDARTLIDIMQEISREKPVMWGPSIIGFGSKHYKYETGREGDMPRLGFSPRKASITIYFAEGFDRYDDMLAKLGKHKQSVSCLYINKLTDIDLDILREMLKKSYRLASEPHNKPATVDEYISSVPRATRTKFNELRQLVKGTLLHSEEVLSYGIIGYKIDDKRPRVYVSGWKDHVAMYPIPKDEALKIELAPYIKGKGTLWFKLDDPLPRTLIKSTVKALAS